MESNHKQDYPHEYPGEFVRPDFTEIKTGDVVYVRAVVTGVEISSWHTTVSVKEYTDYGGHSWNCDNVNSVDIWKRKDQP